MTAGAEGEMDTDSGAATKKPETQNTELSHASEQAHSQPTAPLSARKRPRPNAGQVHHQQTLRHPHWSYLHLKYLTTTAPNLANSPHADVLTLRQDLTSGLNQLLGLTGTAIPVDILKVDDRDAWIRVPREDGPAVHEALSGWTGGKSSSGAYRWVVEGRDNWLFRLASSDGQDLFDD